MPKAIADQFTTITSSGWSATTKLMQATAVGGANSVATQMSFPAASAGGATQRMVPQATATTTAIPAAPAAWSGVGWASPVLDGANVHAVTTDLSAYTITFLVANSGWTQQPPVTWTAILYLGEPNGGPMVEIGRGTSGAAVSGTVSITVTPAASQSSGASTSPRLCIELYGVVGVGVGGLGTNLITVATAGTTARLSTGGAYTSQWARSGTVTSPSSVTLGPRTTSARKTVTSAPSVVLRRAVTPLPKTVTSAPAVALKRSVGLTKAATTAPSAVLGPRGVSLRRAATATPVPAFTRRVTAFRTAATTTAPTPGFARALVAARTFTVTTAPAPVYARTVSASRTFTTSTGPTVLLRRSVGVRKATTAAPTVAFTRAVVAARSFATTTAPTPGFARAIISARSFTVPASTSASGRIDAPIVALNRIAGPATPDFPVTNPTKTVAGVTRNSAGAVVGGCTVYLVRQVDGFRCQTQTSNAVTGAYSFARDTADPYTYRVVALLAGAPETHGITDLLVPA